MHLRTLLDTDWQYNSAGLAEAYHLVYYLPDGDDKTSWTRRIINFKSKTDNEDYEEITRLTVEAIRESGLKFDFSTRILGHEEVVASENAPIHDFAVSVSDAVGAIYCQQFICKKRTTKAVHNLGRTERQAEVSGVFLIANNELDLNNKNLLVIDDISTSCSTIGEMIKILKSTWPSVAVYLICLARTKRNDPNANVDL